MDQDHVDHLAAQWARRRPELDTSALELSARVFRLHRILTRGAAAELHEMSLNEGEFSVLAALRRAEPPHELTPTQLYRSLLLSSGAMTHRLDRLERAGHVVRRPDADDRRRVLVRLTSEGLRAVDRAMDAYAATLARLLSVADEEERAAVNGHLRAILLCLERDGHPA